MNTGERKLTKERDPVGSCFAFVLLMLLSSLSPVVASSEVPTWAQEGTPHGTGQADFIPQQNTTSVEAVVEGALSVASNRTFTGGSASITPLWSSDSSNGTNFGVHSSNQWNGTHQQTNGIGHGGQLTLATEASLGTIAHFETTVRSPLGWMGVGEDHEAWAVVQPTIQPLISQSGMVLPTNGSSSLSALATRGLGDLGGGMSGCIRSPAYEAPTFINNYTLRFQHWLALNSNDAAWVEVQTAAGTWVAISPLGGSNGTTSLPGMPASVWNGETPQWSNATFSLDAHLSQLQPTVEVRFCYATDSNIGQRGGWFIDGMVLENQGDVPGAWFHGNFSGDYLPNAEGQLALSADLTNHTGATVELEISSNWDIEGGAKDYLTVWMSLDNGSTYAPISIYSGHPSTGAICNGVFFNGADSNDEWCPILYTLPWNQTSPQNASNVLFRFWVQTDGQNNFGGTASSGWEGIAIDDVSIWVNRGSPNQSKTSLANFSSQPTQTNGSSDGWLTYVSANVNQWQWTATLGHNGPTSHSEDFEVSFNLPAGWSLDASTNRRWEVGTTSNASGFGPGQWHSGSMGAGIYLDDEYRDNMLTHLYTPEYIVPANSTARLTFRSWVCTEASWDGGAVSISTDGGKNWWFIPPTLNGFHDQISTVNSNSPLFGEGIIDGSNVPGGCNQGTRGFDLKTFDVSNLSGSEVRARFTFFSDQLIELDGWYIDDAGIEIDVYESEGTWVSEPLSPHSVFGWGQVDGFVTQPENTSILFDILDANGTVLDGYEHRSLPILLALDKERYPSLHLRAHLTSNQTLVTPSVQRLTVGSVGYYDAYHHELTPFSGVGLNALSIDEESQLVASSAASLSWTLEAVCPFQSIVLETYGDNLSATHAGLSLDAWTYTPLDQPVVRRVLTQTSTPIFTTPLAFSWSAGAASNGFTFEPQCSLEPHAPVLTLGNTTALFDWPIAGANQSFGLTRGLHAFNGSQTGFLAAVNGSLEVMQSGNQTAELSWLMPIDAPYTPTQMAYDLQFLIQVESSALGGSIEVQQGGPSVSVSPLASAVHHRVTHSATCVPKAVESTPHLGSCSLSLVMSGSFNVKFSQAVIVPAQQKVVTVLTDEVLNSVMDEVKAFNTSSIVVIPLHIATQFGAVAVNLTAVSQPLLVDHILPIAHQRWLPEQSVVFHTQHWRGNANEPGQDAPDITSIELMLSPTKHQADALIHLEIIDADSTPQFRQLDGVAYAQMLSNLSSISCGLNVCNVTWVIQSTWSFDDIDDVHVLTHATDINGLATGPAHQYRQTVFNEIENDLEVVDFLLYDDTQRNLNDWSDSQWPFHLNASQGMVASGAVRFEGIAQSYVGQEEARVRIEAQAVPPVNISGGPSEWSGSPVSWSESWLAEVDANGAFSIPIASPSIEEGVPSGTRILISPHIERIGPINIVSTTSLDHTARSSDVPFLYDRVAPSTISLLALDPGGYASADNHVWMKGQDVALRVTLEDAEGLGNSLILHTWLEAEDDINLDGVMDAIEYTTQTVTFNSGLTNAIVDLPLLSWADITGGASSGRASVVIKAIDLAGNPLEGGGDYGEAYDLGTVHVQERYDTLINTETLSFDIMDGRLLLGREHQFIFSITDGNGINSLDALEFALLGREQSTSCFIEYQPRFDETLFDEACFELPPTVSIEKQGQQQTWVVTMAFRLSWGLMESPLSDDAVPSLKVFDEGQDLGLGLSRLSIFTWNVTSALEVHSVLFQDLTEPIGDTSGDHFWFHQNDVISLILTVNHADTNVRAEHVPSTLLADLVLSDGERSRTSNITFNETGVAETTINISDDVVRHNSGFIDVIIDGPFLVYDLRFNFTIDQSSPQLTVPPGTLVTVDSDKLGAQEVIVILSDQEGLSEGPITMHWQFLRFGEPLEGSNDSAQIGKSAGGGTTNTYAGNVDMQPSSSMILERNDRLEVWFSATDRAGRNVTGYGTSEAPLAPSFRWVAFEPRFDDLIVTPYRPVVGENISIFVRVANEGLLPGNITVQLQDADGRILEANTTELAPGTWVEYTWSLETWTTGRLGLAVVLVDVTGNIPLPMGEVQANQQTNNRGLDTLGFAVLVVFLAAGVLVFSIYRRQEVLAEFTQKQVNAALIGRSEPPPRPKDLDELDEEQ